VRLEDEIDRLYGLDLEAFCPQRNALVRQLRQAGEREAAAAVRQLRKPTCAAWLVNRVVRAEPGLLAEFLRAGAALREAQARTLAGEGAQMLREAAAAERAAAEDLVSAARGFLPRGRLASRPVLARVRDTLQAATRDAQVRESVRAGRLQREATAAGWPVP
jgi:hypothetical protein